MVSLGKAWLNRNHLIMITAVIDVGSKGWYHLSLNLAAIVYVKHGKISSHIVLFKAK